MKIIQSLLLVSIFIVLLSCTSSSPISKPPTKTTASPTTDAFCGRSTKGPCQSDADCRAGGCSGQICQSKKEEGGISTCEYRDCYDASKYGVKCGCVNQACQWR